MAESETGWKLAGNRVFLDEGAESFLCPSVGSVIFRRSESISDLRSLGDITDRRSRHTIFRASTISALANHDTQRVEAEDIKFRQNPNLIRHFQSKAHHYKSKHIITRQNIL